MAQIKLLAISFLRKVFFWNRLICMFGNIPVFMDMLRMPSVDYPHIHHHPFPHHINVSIRVLRRTSACVSQPFVIKTSENSLESIEKNSQSEKHRRSGYWWWGAAWWCCWVWLVVELGLNNFNTRACCVLAACLLRAYCRNKQTHKHAHNQLLDW